MASKSGFWGRGVMEEEGDYVSVQSNGILSVLASRR